MTNREQAIAILTHYLRVAWDNSGVRWEEDNSREIEELVDLLLAREPEPQSDDARTLADYAAQEKETAAAEARMTGG